jgi:hypothetical protein
MDPKRSPNKRWSPKQPLFAALVLGALTAFCDGLGFRGKFHPAQEPISFNDIIRNFIFIFLCFFVIFYLARILGIKNDFWDD